MPSTPECLHCHIIDLSTITCRPRFRPRNACPPSSSVPCKLEGPEKTVGFQPVRPVGPRVAREAAPAVSDQFSIFTSSQPGARRMEMDAIRHDFEIVGIAVRCVDRDRLVAPLENMSAPQPPPVATLAEPCTPTGRHAGAGAGQLRSGEESQGQVIGPTWRNRMPRQSSKQRHGQAAKVCAPSLSRNRPLQKNRTR